ncbi:hypothetical protein E5Q53_02235 [Haemophilus parahaemolyticus]|uniref:Intracellular septation protein A n=2 Tax=Haemophilus parahaemolyticus TaxID=735 RepID=A0AAE6JQA6_HAEPH|nr:hypothetical protein [Haemophilus parahaemolyticus]EIJ69621.1 putative membrane protein [Haemophilus parahaemolyticus HK385]OOR96885.1 hypothetical protein B0185_04595 [Haemophilus parahaemolyticus]QEN10372.1 hypothetical protein E5Q53_02235 [Haemophilus parahaemolyticus]QRP13359.1 hypothetical protein I6J29_04235 [Haemophilus parahaemolyticus]STO65766.1 intracellular septation protein A [Haemophilus parahaemolyticus HK385]
MPINFPQLLQDSWNFIRNRRQFSLTAIGLLLAIQLLATFVLANLMASNSTVSLLPSLLIGIGNIFISVLLVLNINDINAGTFQSFFQNTGKALTKLLPAILLYIIMGLPLSFGMSSILFGNISGSGANIFSLPLLAIGIFVFVRLNLSTYVFLVENYRVGQAVKFMWQLAKGKMAVLFAYTLLANLLPILITALVGRLGDNVAIMVLSFMISAFLSLFTTIFSFRFYQTIRPKRLS